MYEGPRRRIGIFRPKKIESVRECMLPLIGKQFEFEYAGTSDDDEMFPGQTRWVVARKHDPELDDDQIGRWLPDEDIESVNQQEGQK